MDLGVRHIRTAGKGSGSVELTLPTEFRDLVGLPCRITLRDGNRPDIVLQPDLRRAHAAFAELWAAMAAALLPQDTTAPALPLGAFSFGLQPQAGGNERPFLCWRDGLSLAAEPPHEPAAVGRTVAALAQAIAAYLPIASHLAASFGAVCGALAAGAVVAPDGQEAYDLAAAALPAVVTEAADTADACASGVRSPIFWQHTEPRLAGIADLFAQWTSDPDRYAALRAAWRRGRSIEMGGDLA